TVLFRGMLGRLSILIGVLVGYAAAWLQGQVDFSTVSEAAWIGLPSFHAPAFDLGYLGLFLPVVLVLIAENIGHVKSVAAMTGRDLDSLTGRTLFADGFSTILAGSGGGSGTTTYAENIGVMAATRIFSTAAYLCAAIIAFCLGLLPKFGEIIATIPSGVLGGAATVLYGMIGMLGVRIWVENRVGFSNPLHLNTGADSHIAAIANLTSRPAGLHVHVRARRTHRGDRELHLDSRRTPVRGDRPGHRLGDHRLPSDEGDRPVARHRPRGRGRELRRRRRASRY